jgi:hypothetical protein
MSVFTDSAMSTHSKERAPDSLAGIHDLFADRWLHAVAVGGSYRLTVYQQEEELAPPWFLLEVATSAERLAALLSVVALSGPDQPVTIADVKDMAKGCAGCEIDFT